MILIKLTNMQYCTIKILIKHQSLAPRTTWVRWWSEMQSNGCLAELSSTYLPTMESGCNKNISSMEYPLVPKKKWDSMKISRRVRNCLLWKQEAKKLYEQIAKFKTENCQFCNRLCRLKIWTWSPLSSIILNRYQTAGRFFIFFLNHNNSGNFYVKFPTFSCPQFGYLSLALVLNLDHLVLPLYICSRYCCCYFAGALPLCCGAISCGDSGTTPSPESIYNNPIINITNLDLSHVLWLLDL